MAVPLKVSKETQGELKGCNDDRFLLLLDELVNFTDFLQCRPFVSRGHIIMRIRSCVLETLESINCR